MSGQTVLMEGRMMWDSMDGGMVFSWCWWAGGGVVVGVALGALGCDSD